MKCKYVLFMFLFILSLGTVTVNVSFAQGGPSDTSLHISDSLACSGDVFLNTAILGQTPIGIPLSFDDNCSGILPIGFSYTYYGNTYTQCVLSSNGYITFDLSQANQYTQWDLTGGGNTLPGNPNCRNSICGCYSDIEPLLGGTVYYATIGTAPYRKFVVTFCNNPMFNCNNQLINFQMVLDETTNTTETYIHKKYICSGWNGGRAIEGVQNAAGTAGTTVAGRNNTQWLATDDGQQFVPNATMTAYTVSAVPYAPIPNSNATINYYQGTTYIGSGNSVVVHPTDTTTYTVQVVSCEDTATNYVTVDVTPGVVMVGTPHITTFTSISPQYCGGIGSITLTGLVPFSIDTIFYDLNGILQPPVVVIPGVDSTVVLDSATVGGGLCVGTYSNIVAKVGYCTSPPVGPLTLSTIPTVAAFTYVIHYGCAGDTVVCFNQSTPSSEPLTYTWNFGDGTTSNSVNPVHIYSSQGVYNLQLIASIGGSCSICADTATQTVTLVHPLQAVFTTDKDSICVNNAITFTNSSVSTPPPSYLWNFGDGYTDTATNTVHTYNQTGSFDATLTVTDFVPCQSIASQEIYVESITATPPFADTSFCLYDSLRLGVQVTTAGPNLFSNIIYQWSPADGLGNPNVQQPNFFEYGDHTYIFTATGIPEGCASSDTITLHAYPPLVLDSITADQTIPYGGSIQLNAGNAYYYFWVPNDGSLNNPNISNPIATPHDSTTYEVIGMTALGCRDSAFIHIGINYAMNEIVPNAFSPNNDGKNDVFKIMSVNFQRLVDFSVYNRWGQQVFHTTNPAQGWDGTANGVPQGIDTYNYIIVVVEPDGIERSYRGSVILVR